MIFLASYSSMRDQIELQNLIKVWNLSSHNVVLVKHGESSCCDCTAQTRASHCHEWHRLPTRARLYWQQFSNSPAESCFFFHEGGPPCRASRCVDVFTEREWSGLGGQRNWHSVSASRRPPCEGSGLRSRSVLSNSVMIFVPLSMLDRFSLSPLAPHIWGRVSCCCFTSATANLLTWPHL